MNRSRARVISTICTDIAQVLFGVSIAAVVLPLDSGKMLVVILEIVFAVTFWVLALMFGEKGKL